MELEEAQRAWQEALELREKTLLLADQVKANHRKAEELSGNGS